VGDPILFWIQEGKTGQPDVRDLIISESSQDGFRLFPNGAHQAVPFWSRAK
jgi:hypothetical protein